MPRTINRMSKDFKLTPSFASFQEIRIVRRDNFGCAQFHISRKLRSDHLAKFTIIHESGKRPHWSLLFSKRFHNLKHTVLINKSE